MSISYDNKIMITGSADKNIKIWGLDFGDCHKSLFAHVDSIMALQFIPNTHLFVSCSKDNTIKYWDADSFININTIGRHFGEVLNWTSRSYFYRCGRCVSLIWVILLFRVDMIVAFISTSEQKNKCLLKKNEN